METYALDYETYYDDECSVKKLGPRGYFAHPDFDAYMVTVAGPDGYEWVGHPRDFDWSLLENNRVLAHNASFDESLYLYGVERGWWPLVRYAEWHCTADMVAYCGFPRSLANASAEVFELVVDKTTRDTMKGKRWGGMTPEFRQEVSEYALKDARLCLDLWAALADKWPENERAISRVNRKAVQRGLPMDLPALAAARENIALRLHEAEQAVPWLGQKPLLSRKAFNDACREVGVEPPASLDLNKPGVGDWIRANGLKYTWIAAVSDWRRINAVGKKLEAFENGCLDDGRYYGGLMYFGAGATGRFSGSGGNLNLQNLTKGELFGVNMRQLIRPKAGRSLLVVDLSQIEVRTLCWLAGFRRMLDEIAKADDIYEVFAVNYGWWSPEKGRMREKDPNMRNSLVKPTTLGCGYQAGAARLAEASNMPLEQAEVAVRTYRSTMKPVVDLWRYYQSVIHNCAATGKPLAVGLPSGRVMRYGKIHHRTKQYLDPVVLPDGQTTMIPKTKTEYYALTQRGGVKKTPSKLYGGLLVENLSQGLARDVFADMLVRIDAAGHELLFHVHDEAVVECAENEAEDRLADILQIMSTPPEWIADLPVAAEGKITDVYTK